MVWEDCEYEAFKSLPSKCERAIEPLADRRAGEAVSPKATA
jgi:hypothetical protein